MQKIIVRNIAIFSIIGLLLIIIASYGSLSGLAMVNQNKSAASVLGAAAQKLEQNDKDIIELKASLSAEYLEKSRAFAHMIKLDPSILEDQEELNKIVDELGVDELHVTDENGILRWGTIEGYFGFDFATSEQAAPFMKILEDPTYELAQEPTPNGAEGKMFQYVGVSRQDKKGIVQVGILPSKLDEALANNSLQNVLLSFRLGTNGFVYAIDATTGEIEAFPDESYIGKDAAEEGLDVEGKWTHLRYGDKIYYANRFDTGNRILIGALPMDELYSQRNVSLAINMAFFVVVFIALILIIATIIKKSISQSLNRIVGVVQEISDGNMNARVNERKFREFEILSDGINGMVENISNKMSETERLMSGQNRLIGEVVNATDAINNYTSSMKSNSESISIGATTQAASVEQITSFCESLLNQVNVNSKNAKEASIIAEESQEKLNNGMELILKLNEAMGEMSEASRSIEQVINTVSNIAFQTNILALNASVEAARAGEQGKGFSVVAQEVRALAGKCAESAENTSTLIQHALETVDKGLILNSEVSESMKQILERTQESTKYIEDISIAAETQAAAVNEMSQGLNQISEVIQKNVILATEAESTANKLFDEVDNLGRMVGKVNA